MGTRLKGGTFKTDVGNDFWCVGLFWERVLVSATFERFLAISCCLARYLIPNDNNHHPKNRVPIC